MTLSSFLYIVFIFHFFFTSPSLSLSSDGLALLALKSAVDEPSAAAFSDWNNGDPTPCAWSGIACANVSGEGEPRVVGISLAGKSLSGYLPSELGTLRFLRRLNLHDNAFSGVLPAQLSNATALHSLFLHGNNLSGAIPSSLCTLPRLQNLDLSENAFSGHIPEHLRNCKNLQRLVLAGNKFSGEIPAGVWPDLQNLLQLDLSDNELTGSIPSEIGTLISLSGTLNLSFNHLSGKIPSSLGKLPATVIFDLKNNNLSGEIPQTGSFSNQGPTAFLGNPDLCGFPLRKSCSGSDRNFSSGSDQNKPDNGNRSKGLSPGLIILISAADAAVVALIGLVIVYIYWKRKDDENACSCIRKRSFGEEKGNMCVCGGLSCFGGVKSDDDDDEEFEGGEGEGEGELVRIDKGLSFELDELLRASAYVLGKSGLGIVYKVVLGNGVPVAVRRLGEGGEQRYKEFAAEVMAIGKVKHPNVVRLRAYYWAHDEKLLISDFISNGNLAHALRGRNGQPSTNLSWSTRLRIAKGTARGLAYLHECSPRKFVHGDIKPSNILLDNDFQPYISDFGLNRLISITGNNPSTGGFMGGALPYMNSSQKERTNNYKAPEARVPGCRTTQKWDVYSFGVVLLEILTGRSPESSPTTSTSMEVPDLVRWVRKGFDQESPLSEMVDPSLLQEVRVKKEVLAVFHVALSCTEEDPEARPRMKTVCENLDKIGT
uniref:Protein kinase domain-containing protein n=1 Tax=Glycine max TaxID=3847 RepID=I1JL75_SOYBN|eukprot:XP_006576501.1 receptor protein kinase-like protein ZAR1 [Glycine max]